MPTLSSTIPYLDCFPAHLSSSLSWFYAAYTCTVIHTEEVNLCLNCSEQKTPNYFSKAVCVPPTWSDHFLLVNPFQSIRQLWAREPISINQATLGSWTHLNQSGNFGFVNPCQSIRQLWAREPMSINQATLGLWTHFNQPGNFGLLSFLHSSLSYYSLPLYSLVALFICACYYYVHYLLCALFICVHYLLCALFSYARCSMVLSLH